MLAFQELLKGERRDFRIVETGTSSNGTASTHMFDRFVTEFGGTVDTIDLDPATVERAKQTVGINTRCHMGNSLKILPTLQSEKPIDLLYLDSYDIEWLNPYPSALHHLKEFAAIESQLTIGSLVLIDDTPNDVQWFDCKPHSEMVQFIRQYNLPVMGKGTLIERYLLKLGAYEKLLHQYQILWKKVS
jgi:predicted O-methyltransferase YrrM